MTQHFLSHHLTLTETVEAMVLLQETLKLLNPYLREGTILTEVPLQSMDPHHKTITKGMVDFLWIHENTIHLIDYKTGSFSAIPSSRYVEQMTIYKSVLKKIYPNHTIQTFLFWIDAQKIIETF